MCCPNQIDFVYRLSARLSGRIFCDKIKKLIVKKTENAFTFYEQFVKIVMFKTQTGGKFHGKST